MKKIIKYLLVLIPVFIIGIWFFIFYLPKTDFYKNITAKKIAPITAVDIAKDFLANEDSAFIKYSGKQIEVSGEVVESKMENGKTAVYFKSNDEFTHVYFLLKDSIGLLKSGELITLKGICTGYLGDIQFNEGEIVK